MALFCHCVIFLSHILSLISCLEHVVSIFKVSRPSETTIGKFATFPETVKSIYFGCYPGSFGSKENIDSM